MKASEVRKGAVLMVDGQPCRVLDFQHRTPGNLRAFVQMRMRNLISGAVVEYSFHQSEKAEEAEIDSRRVKYLYANRGQFWFCEEKDPSKRFFLPEETVGARGQFMKPNMLVDMLSFGEKLVGIKMPVKVELQVVEAPPGIKGDTRQGGSKKVLLETGAAVNAPLFINEGDVVVVNSETGEYVGRAEKK